MPDLTVTQVLGAGACSPTCLCAHGSRESATCTCPCGGRWHGLFARTSVPGSATITPTHPGPACAGQADLLDAIHDLDKDPP